MKTNPLFSLMLAMTVIAMAVIGVKGVAEEPQQDDRKAIEQRAQSYATAYNAKDLKALVDHWAPEGVYINRATGRRVTGRDALEQDFQVELDSRKDSRLEISVESVDLVSPGVAMERGTSTIKSTDSEPIVTHYNAVHVRRNGQWLIDRISEREVVDPPTHYEQLKDLEWMIGNWSDQAGEGVVSTECQWARNNNFLVRSFTVSIAGAVDMAGMQFIGWDEAKKQIRSWAFDSDGGFNQGVWKKSGDRWSVQHTATLPDGTLASSTSLIAPVDENSFTWQKVSRVVGGEILPNLSEIVVVRQATK